MNNLTKEELQLLLSDVAQCAIEYSRTVEQDELMSKLQSLIDNYCEHSDFELDDRHYACNNCAAIWQ